MYSYVCMGLSVQVCTARIGKISDLKTDQFSNIKYTVTVLVYLYTSPTMDSAVHSKDLMIT